MNKQADSHFKILQINVVEWRTYVVSSRVISAISADHRRTKELGPG